MPIVLVKVIGTPCYEFDLDMSWFERNGVEHKGIAKCKTFTDASRKGYINVDYSFEGGLGSGIIDLEFKRPNLEGSNNDWRFEMSDIRFRNDKELDFMLFNATLCLYRNNEYTQEYTLQTQGRFEKKVFDFFKSKLGEPLYCFE